MPEIPIIPETITVHLGAPNAPARNVTVPFTDYIKNVASSEIYPTWPESALRANMLAQITFALNRVYTEWYRSQGYDFDITNNTQYDQKFIEGRDYFDNIVNIADEIFNDYIVKQGSVQPYFTRYCDGIQSTCDGLSQWGSVDLAEEGLSSYEILTRYFGSDINIVENAPLNANIPSYPGIPLRLGSVREDVRTIQLQLNRISDNYPAIPKISNTNGIFGIDTERSVRKFQEIFNLTTDGVVGKATWYRIKYIYSAVKGLADLYSEGITIDEATRAYPEELSQGSRGVGTGYLQYLLAVIGYFDSELPEITVDGIYGQNTANAVIAFQNKYGLTPTGIVDRNTYNKMLSVYDEVIRNLSPEFANSADELFPGRFLTIDSSGPDVLRLNTLLSIISDNDPSIPAVNANDTFDETTLAAVTAVQRQQNLPLSGAVGPLTWFSIINRAQEYEQQ